MSAEEHGCWEALYRIEPWGDERADLHSAHIVSTLANIHRDTETAPNPFTLGDCLLRFGEESGPPPEPSQEEVEAKIIEFMRARAK